MFGFAAGAAAGGGGAARGAAGGGGAGGAAASAGLFIINIVPLNFGAPPAFKAKPHLVQLVVVSAFCVPQFGQNTSASVLVSARGTLRIAPRISAAASPVSKARAAYTRTSRSLKEIVSARRLAVRGVRAEKYEKSTRSSA
jgi:hypothetical protein